MSDALSELRIMADGWRNQSGNSGGLRYAADDLDEFIADHPGLVDRTIHCTECGAPGPEFPPRGWTGVWVPDDGEHFRCPTCAGKGAPCSHDWEPIGMCTGGAQYECRKCGTTKVNPT